MKGKTEVQVDALTLSECEAAVANRCGTLAPSMSISPRLSMRII